MRSSVVRLSKTLGSRGVRGSTPVLDFLCPALSLQAQAPTLLRRQRRPVQRAHRLPANRHGVHTITSQDSFLPATLSSAATLPTACSGCGALSQDVDPDEAGYYSTKRLRRALSAGRKRDTRTVEALLGTYEVSEETLQIKKDTPPASTPPVCDRCHALHHHQTGVSISHPSLSSIAATIDESPYKYNHIYHVLDAADFPLSLIPTLHRRLSLSPQRSQNRRSQSSRFSGNRKAEISFIITRSDLLAPRKELLDQMMPYLTEVLRAALGKDGEDVRLGNVRCVSSKRGWWTKEVKEEIWSRGGGGWMVGKVNVGKSLLFESVFPKGRSEKIKFGQLRRAAGWEDEPIDAAADERVAHSEELARKNTPAVSLDTASLLPPPQAETPFPTMPLVSSLPGTTASPIRLPFGSAKGELIDLPGLSRGDLESYVRPEHRLDLVMTARPKPEQQAIKPGQSLLLDGLIRITPATPGTVVLAYAFVPFGAHVTSTEKAIGIQTHTRESGVKTMTTPQAVEKIRSAGRFRLQWDVTRLRTGPITAKSAVGLKTERLPYRVWSADLLIESVGWVELVAQVRRRGGKGDDPDHAEQDGEAEWPEVEVFSPEGRHVGIRRPMNAWMIAGLGEKGKGKVVPQRPRPSMKGRKKQEKIRARM